MTLKIIAKFEEKIICCFKNDKNLVKFDLSTFSKTCNFICSYCAKYLMFDLKKYRGVIFHDTEEWCKIWRKTDLWFGKWHEEYGKFSPEHLKVSKLGLWWDPLIQSKKKYELKIYRGIMLHDNEEWCKIWRKTDLSFGKRHEEFGNFSPEHSKVWKLEIWWDCFVQSKECMSLKSTEEFCVMAMKNHTKIEEELTCRFKINMRNFTNFDPSTQKSKKFEF